MWGQRSINQLTIWAIFRLYVWFFPFWPENCTCDWFWWNNGTASEGSRNYIRQQHLCSLLILMPTTFSHSSFFTFHQTIWTQHLLFLTPSHYHYTICLHLIFLKKIIYCHDLHLYCIIRLQNYTYNTLNNYSKAIHCWVLTTRPCLILTFV